MIIVIIILVLLIILMLKMTSITKYDIDVKIYGTVTWWKRAKKFGQGPPPGKLQWAKEAFIDAVSLGWRWNRL